MRKLFLLSVAFLFAIANVNAQDAASKKDVKTEKTKIVKNKKSTVSNGARSLARFNKIDDNKDSSISEKEFLAVQKISFEKKDKSKDGKLNKAEFSPTLAKAVKGTGARSLARFNKLDTNKDDNISSQEFLAAQKISFDKKDKDKDGKLNKSEFSPTLAKLNKK